VAKNCTTNKRGYASEALAEEALIDARTRHGNEKDGPTAVYRCDDCGQYHLTSKGPMNPRLAEYIKDGKLKLNQEANRWLGKLK